MDTRAMAEALQENTIAVRELRIEMEYSKQDRQNLNCAMNELNKTLANLPQKLDERYADKRVEVYFDWGVKIILGAIIGSSLGLILIK